MTTSVPGEVTFLYEPPIPETQDAVMVGFSNTTTFDVNEDIQPISTTTVSEFDQSNVNTANPAANANSAQV